MNLQRFYGMYSSWIDFVLYFAIFASVIRIALWNYFEDKRAVKLLIAGGGAFFALALTLWTDDQGYKLLHFGPFSLLFLISFIVFIMIRFFKKPK